MVGAGGDTHRISSRLRRLGGKPGVEDRRLVVDVHQRTPESRSTTPAEPPNPTCGDSENNPMMSGDVWALESQSASLTTAPHPPRQNVIDRAVETQANNEERLLGVLTSAERRTLVEDDLGHPAGGDY
jgi:hypothetical protein